MTLALLRSGIAVELDLPERSIPLPREVEVAIFRVVQESLSNVLKHSQSSTVRVAFGCSRITITVEDQGKGLPPTALKIGVGIASM